MKPEDVGYLTELDHDFGHELKAVHDIDSFQSFLDKYNYWLDPESKILKGTDYEWIEPLMKDARTEGVMPEDKHEPVLKLMMPEKLIKVSMVKQKFMCPWGTAYIRMREENIIDY